MRRPAAPGGRPCLNGPRPIDSTTLYIPHSAAAHRRRSRPSLGLSLAIGKTEFRLPPWAMGKTRWTETCGILAPAPAVEGALTASRH